MGNKELHSGLKVTVSRLFSASSWSHYLKSKQNRSLNIPDRNLLKLQDKVR